MSTSQKLLAGFIQEGNFYADMINSITEKHYSIPIKGEKTEQQLSFEWSPFYTSQTQTLHKSFFRGVSIFGGIHMYYIYVIVFLS